MWKRPRNSTTGKEAGGWKRHGPRWEAAAEGGGAVTVQVQVQEVSASARIAEQQFRIRLALPALTVAHVLKNALNRLFH